MFLVVQHMSRRSAITVLQTIRRRPCSLFHYPLDARDRDPRQNLRPRARTCATVGLKTVAGSL